MQEKLNPRKLHKEMQALRTQGHDVTLAQHLNDSYDGMSLGKYYNELEVDPQRTTVQLLLDRQDESNRWLVPEIFRDAIRKGFIAAPIHQDFIIGEEPVPQPTQIMPFWDLTSLKNEPKALGVAESMELGTISYGQKTVRISKTGIGIEVADEAIRYTSVSLLSIFLQDVGIKLASSLSKSAINVLINGDQADLSENSAVVGVATAATMTYADFITMFVRGSLLNRKWTKTIGNEATINFLLNMPEFRNTDKFGNSELKLNTKTPVPRDIDAYTHSSMPNNQLLMVDPSLAMVQLTAVPLQVEADRIVQRQINGTYVSLTTGFAIIMRDARVILDRSVTIGASPFPAFLAPKF